MTWEVLDLEHGDVLAAYGSFDAAKADLVAFVDEHPERCDELAIASIDESGHAREHVSATELVAHA